jgi:nuclear transport factor 2 (NTF2) superfamily protein
MSPIRMARLETAIHLVLAFNEAFNRHDVAGMLGLISDNCLFESTSPAPDGTLYSGKGAIKKYLQGSFLASPQSHMEIEEIFSLGLRCVMRWRYEWVDDAGEKAHVRGVDIYRVQDGLICGKLSYVKG